MSDLYPQNWPAYLEIFLVFLRLLGLFLVVPGFSHKSIPPTIKLSIALALSLGLYPMVRPYLVPLEPTLGGLVLASLRESIVGFLMGFTAYITFEAINLGAQFVGYQMGFGSAGLIGPQNQASVSVLVPLYGWLALMVFFFADMHHNVIKLFVLSFQATRGFQDGVLSNTAVLAQIALLAGKLFVLAVQMAAPFTALVLVVNVALGVLGRTMPQMNIMLFSFPLTMIFGFCAMYLVAPDLLDYMVQVMGDLSGECLNLLRSL